MLKKFTFNRPRTGQSLATTLAISLFALSALVLLISSALQIALNIQSQQAALSSRQQFIAQEASKSVSSYILEKFSELDTAVKFSSPLTATIVSQKNIMEGLLGLDPAFQQFALFNSRGMQVAKISRVSSTLSRQFISLWTGDILTQTSKDQQFISPVYFDDATSEPLISIAIPVKDSIGDFQGTLIAEVDLKFMWDLVDQLKVGESGYAYVVDNKGNLIAFHDTSRVLQGENDIKIGKVSEFVKNPGLTADITPGISSYSGLLGSTVVGTYVPLGTPQWAVITELPWQEAYQGVLQNVWITIAILLVMALLAGLAGVFLARRLSVPLVKLTEIATRIAGGEMELQTAVGGPLEVASLSSAFNHMTTQLRDLISTLEQRIADRTKALATSAEVSRRLSNILDQHQLVIEVVEQLRSAFGYYHAHIYLVDELSGDLVMAGGTGEAGKSMLAQGHKVSQGKGLVGRAANTKDVVLVPDTTQDRAWLPNPLLPETKSEIAVPIMAGDKVLGVLDVQNNIVESLGQQDATLIRSIADQVAIAIQNVRQYEATQHTTEQLSEALEIARLANWEYDVEKDRFHFNDHFYSIFHTTAEQVGGYEISSAQYAQHLVHPDDVPMVGGAIEKALASKDRHYSTQLEHRILYADGGIGHISVVVHIDRDEQGRIIRYYGANQDITERKQAEEALAKQAAEASMLNDISQKILSTTTIETALQVAAREVGHALGMKPTRVSLDPSALARQD